MRFIRKAGAPTDKSLKRLHVEPAELARKLVKEMDDHTVKRGQHVWARNRFTIYLCSEDYEKLSPRQDQITADLTDRLARHVHDRGYRLQGDLTVEMEPDQDLELGYFGILAQRAYPVRPSTEVTAEPAPPLAPAEDDWVAAALPPIDKMKIPASTEVLAPKQAEELGLERGVIVITSGDQVREFTQSRVILGRSKEADLRIDDPNVSRKHAAVYWNAGRLMLEDLGSTNGTMVNGYPVTSTVLRPRDVVAIGESRLTVETK